MAEFTCLLVDDDTDDHELFEDQIKKISNSFHYVKAFNGKDAIEKLLNHAYKPDIIFLDLNMPLMDGKQFLKELKSRENLKDIPVVILSTSSSQQSKNEMLELGAIEFMSKPYKLADWESGLKQIFKRLFPGIN